MTAAHFLRTGLLALTFTAALAGCNTGNGSGETNVERGADKNTDPAALNPQASDSAAAGLQSDTTHNPTGRQVYEQAGDSKDRNNDGIAD
ncbi:hypothetical protein FY528_02760 [Hymenobacter lutimineralis]|uniref:Lipoprotein n=1 Tax=Hymenobacter lutimineralis TaxID=2606448 RepID=A0A5D6VF71_9BACT|nr:MULTISPECIES: hypothetical protein [Hymenobacter]QIX61132.1 hypothetical protein HER32_08040 [Hymenobacter sp. BT18]TYZ13348.1 hypothetical protein FY528_02760 [Hymenobacter lutimineralis]